MIHHRRSARSKPLSFMTRSVSIVVLFSSPALQEISVQKHQVQCTRISGLPENFQLEIDSDHREKVIKFSWYPFWPLIRRISPIVYLITLIYFSVACEMFIRSRDERRELSEHCRHLSKLDELHTQHRYSMDRWARLRFTLTEVHFIRPNQTWDHVLWLTHDSFRIQSLPMMIGDLSWQESKFGSNESSVFRFTACSSGVKK